MIKEKIKGHKYSAESITVVMPRSFSACADLPAHLGCSLAPAAIMVLASPARDFMWIPTTLLLLKPQDLPQPCLLKLPHVIPGSTTAHTFFFLLHRTYSHFTSYCGVV